MGAQQSSTSDDPASSTPNKKTCYYDLLGVERQATDDEIKKAYRRRALELHPDRNYGNEEEATQRFAEVQAAYEVLSDPQERAWYDSHRDAVLSGRDVEEGDISEFSGVRLTTADDIYTLIRRFNSTVPFTDDPGGFYGIARETFEHLAAEETAAARASGQESVDLPTFGSSDDTFDFVVKNFYKGWSNFSTRKSYSWRDKYRVADAIDRWTRRQMEKENKKFRDEAIAEFNDAVRFLVAFVRKRDPRYTPNSQTDAERQKALRDAAAARSARDRAANQEKLKDAQVADWAQSRGTGDIDGEFSEEEDLSEVEHIECVVCNKTFKSEKQFEAHEKSKKHTKAVQQLRRQMEKEGIDLGLSSRGPNGREDRESDGESASAGSRTVEPAVSFSQDQKINMDKATNGGPVTIHPDDSAESTEPSELGDEYAPRATVEERLATATIEDDEVEDAAVASGTESHIRGGEPELGHDDDQVRKVGKAKQKREKKAARQAANDDAATGQADGEHKCSVCQAPFASKTKLFAHIRELGHAAPVLKAAKGRKAKR